MKKALSIALISVIICAIGGLIYIMVMPKVGERFTEFYILGPEGKAENYPSELVLGEETKVIVGIVNREHRETSYRLVVMVDGVEDNEIAPIMLAHEEKWEDEVRFLPRKAGKNRKVEFLLFREGESEPYNSLYLWIDVTP